MYRIINVTDGQEYVLHDQRDRKLTVLEPHLNITLNKTGILEFQILAEHRYYNTLKKLKSSIRVIEDGKLIYEGRIIIDESDFYNTRSITVEGSLAYTLDTMQRPFVVSGNVSTREFLQQMIESHNSQVEERKRLVLGQVTVVDTDSQADRENKTITNTWNVLATHLLERAGGYLWISYQGEQKILNYTWDYGGYNEQEIRFGVNLLDLSKYQDATEIITRVIPTGAEIEYKNELGEKQTKTLDISSVNGGVDYLDADQSAIEEFGIITCTLNWPNITDPEKLKQKTKAYLKESVQIPETLTISAVDLNYAGVDISRFRLGYYTNVTSRQHDLKKELLLAKLDLYLDDPAKGSISLGGTQTTFTSSVIGKQAELSKTVQKVAENASEEINRKVENATSLITGGFGGYFIIDDIDPVTGKKTHPWRTLWMNTPDRNTATNVVQINQNGFGFSTTGINGPYRNAWTIDGNFVADFVTMGSMLADRIRGGTLELGGTGLGKDGSIKILSSTGKVIGTIDKNGVIFRDGIYIGGSIEIGDVFYADDDGAKLGDYEVSADGSNVLKSANGYVKFNCNAAEPGWPIGDYATLEIGGDGSNGVKLDGGTGKITCSTVKGNDVFADNCNLAQGNDRIWGLGETMDWFWDEFEKLRYRVDSLE